MVYVEIDWTASLRLGCDRRRFLHSVALCDRDQSRPCVQLLGWESFAFDEGRRLDEGDLR
jgi:hypothetical protein